MVTGSKVRIRLTANTDVDPYTISEVGLKFVQRGEENEYD